MHASLFELAAFDVAKISVRSDEIESLSSIRVLGGRLPLRQQVFVSQSWFRPTKVE